MKKMMLLEEGEVERLRQKQIKEYDPTLSAMARAQLELEAVLANNKLNDEEKLTLLHNAQEKFRQLKSAIGTIVTPPSIVTLPPLSMVAQAAHNTPPSIPTLPDADRSTRANTGTPPGPTVAEDSDYEKFKDLLSQHPRVLRSNIHGELVYKNKIVPGSSYFNLTESMRSGKDFTQPGFEQFIQGIKSIQAPLELFKNENFRQLLHPSSPTPTLKLESSPSAKSDVLDETKSIFPLDVSLSTSSRASRKSARKSKAQSGTGSAAPPPGKRPTIIWLYH